MLKTVTISGNRKTGPIAVTYRSGEHSTYGTCPKTCALHPQSAQGTLLIDQGYMLAVYDGCPKGGVSWVYSHFPAHALPKPRKGKTTFNYSADALGDAVAAVKAGTPAVYAAPADTADHWPRTIEGVRFVRCPAETSDRFSCHQCGNGLPLCARGRRDFVVVFVAHGSGSARVGTDREGGCYATSGPVALVWHGTRRTGAREDAAALRAWIRTLPRGSMIRHHVAGDIGQEVTS
jgi:hypothetical protein